ncbi:MAG: hypothetical protein ABI405_08910, partial [Parafilimonas sp.]
MDTIVIMIFISVVLRYTGLLKLFKMTKRKRMLKTKNTNELFDQYFIEAKVFYMKIFNAVPCVAYIGNVDIKKIFEMINNGSYGKVEDIYQRIYHDWDDDKIYFSKTLFILEDKMMVKLCDDWLEIYFSTKNYN